MKGSQVRGAFNILNSFSLCECRREEPGTGHSDALPLLTGHATGFLAHMNKCGPFHLGKL